VTDLAGARWQKSTFSMGGGNCVEVAALPDGGVAVRNGTDADSPVLRFTPGEWRAFVAGTKDGQFDVAEG
jgi:hypothetical protein